MLQKQSVRKELISRRRQLSLEQALALSFRAQGNLLALPEFDAACSIALYSPVQNEVFTERLLDAALDAQKRVYYPRVCGRAMTFFRVGGKQDLRPGTFNVPEPVGSEMATADSLDLIVVPGVAFDRQGNRLGYGKGYYDRALSGVCPQRAVGLCYEFQLRHQLPSEPHDFKVHKLVTERVSLTCAEHM